MLADESPPETDLGAKSRVALAPIEETVGNEATADQRETASPEGGAESVSSIASPEEPISTMNPGDGEPPSSAERKGVSERAPIDDGHARQRRWLLRGGLGVLLLLLAFYFGVPLLVRMFTTVSTDDAYVNSHVTFVAARVPGQVTKVQVDDNNRVRKGDLLVELDREPYQVQVDIKEAAVIKANADLTAALAQARSTVAQARSQRWKLQHAMEELGAQLALLRAKAAALESDKAELRLAEANFERAEGLIKQGAIASEEYDRREKARFVARDAVEAALAEVAQVRVNLGLPALPAKNVGLAQGPPDVEETFSSVRQAQAELIQSASQLGIVQSFVEMPKQMLKNFYQRAPQGDLDRLFTGLVNDAPAVKQAEARVLQAERDLEHARLNLSYCAVNAEIDGVVTRRNVNPGNNVQAGQGLMAIRSLREIWVDANFKETQLAELRIGQQAELYVDRYGSSRVFRGHISGFTMGTGSTLALLPAENATGNFVKVVQRLPVRIDLDDYDPYDGALFIGLSVVPYVYLRRPLIGPNAGEFLQQRLPPTVTGALTLPRRRHDRCHAFIAGGAGKCQPVVDRCRGGGADLHGSARHHDRRGSPSLHRRGTVRDGRRRRVGHHQLPCGQCHRAAHQRVAGLAPRSPQLLPAVDRCFHAQFRPVRYGDEPIAAGLVPRGAGAGRGRLATIESRRIA